MSFNKLLSVACTPMESLATLQNILEMAGREALMQNGKMTGALLLDCMERYFRGPVSLAVGELPGVARKPEPDMLVHTAAALNVELSRCLYVGDTPMDALCAANAGMDFALADWKDRGWQNIPARYKFSSAAEMEAIGTPAL